MINLFFDTRKLDALARENYELSEEIMMENAAGALESEVMTHAFPSPEHTCIALLF